MASALPDSGSSPRRRILMQDESKRRLFKSKIAIGLLGIMLCTPSLSLGWGAGGHMMVAFIAFKRLNPKDKAQSIALLARPINPAAVSKKVRTLLTPPTGQTM